MNESLRITGPGSIESKLKYTRSSVPYYEVLMLNVKFALTPLKFILRNSSVLLFESVVNKWSLAAPFTCTCCIVENKVRSSACKISKNILTGYFKPYISAKPGKK